MNRQPRNEIDSKREGLLLGPRKESRLTPECGKKKFETYNGEVRVKASTFFTRELKTSPTKGGYMTFSDEFGALIPLDRQLEWEDRLFNSSRYHRCRRGPYGPESLGECEDWDGGYNTSVDPEIDAHRRAAQANYGIWIHEFATRLDVEIEQALEAFDHAGACIPCLGRMLYDFLREEYLVADLEPQSLLNYLRKNGAFPQSIVKDKGQNPQTLKAALQQFTCMRLIIAVQSHCNGEAHFKKLAMLLNNGKSCPALNRDSIGSGRCPSLETEYTEFLLRYRSSHGNPLLYVQMILSVQLAKVWEFMRFMRSKAD